MANKQSDASSCGSYPAPDCSTMITSDHPFLRENFSLEREHYPLIRQHEREGFVKVPNWMPVGWPTYEWVYPNCIDAMMRPAPRWLDRIRWQWTAALTPECVKRWEARRWLRDTFADLSNASAQVSSEAR